MKVGDKVDGFLWLPKANNRRNNIDGDHVGGATMKILLKLAGKFVWMAVIMLSVAMLVVVVLVSLGTVTGQARLTTMLTGSMAPDLPVGSAIVLRPMNTLDVQVGDIIAYNPPNDPTVTVIHRVVSIEGYDPAPVVITKGDANEDIDPYAPIALRNTITWTPTVVVPEAGRALLWFQTGAFVRITLMLVGLGWFIVMWRIWRPKNRETVVDENENENETDDSDSETIAKAEDAGVVVERKPSSAITGSVINSADRYIDAKAP